MISNAQCYKYPPLSARPALPYRAIKPSSSSISCRISMKRQSSDLMQQSAEWQFRSGSCCSRSAQEESFAETSAMGSMDYIRQEQVMVMNAHVPPCGACRRRRKAAVDCATLSFITAEDRLSSTTSNSSRRAPRKPGAFIYPFPLSIAMFAICILLPTTLAAPAPTFKMNPLASPTSGPSPTHQPLDRRRQLGDMAVTAWPSNIPTSVSMLESTALPYMLTQLDDGSWSQIDKAWFLYGRQAGVSRPWL